MTHFLIDGIEFDVDPIANFRKLKENYSSGTFSVSSIGGGTANTEFEVLTGLNLDFFAPGEYPYNTTVNSKTSESINYALKESNYSIMQYIIMRVIFIIVILYIQT